MLHACLYTICFVFCYTSWHFYAFSGTNLLTRCQSASSLFSAVIVLEKLHRKYSRNWTKQKPNLLFLPKLHEGQRWDRGGAQAGHTIGWRDLALAHATRGWDRLVHLLTPPFHLYIPLDGKNLRARSIFLETYCKPPPSSMQDREDPGALPGTLPEAFSTTMVASGVMCE
jgi:hypothetical protein